MKFTPWTITRFLARITWSTLPRLPLSLPAITSTRSFLRIRMRLRSTLSAMALENLRGEGHDLHELLVAQLAGHRAEDAGAHRLAVGVDQDGGVLVEADVGPVAPPLLLAAAHDHGLHHFALANRLWGVGGRLLDVGGDDVPQARVAARGPPQGEDAGDLPGAGVVRHLEDRAHLDHGVASLLGLRQGGLVLGDQRALPDDRLDHPALALGERAALDDAHRVAALRAQFVVGHEGRGPLDAFAVQ